MWTSAGVAGCAGLLIIAKVHLPDIRRECAMPIRPKQTWPAKRGLRYLCAPLRKSPRHPTRGRRLGNAPQSASFHSSSVSPARCWMTFPSAEGLGCKCTLFADDGRNDRQPTDLSSSPRPGPVVSSRVEHTCINKQRGSSLGLSTTGGDNPRGIHVGVDRSTWLARMHSRYRAF